MSKLAGVKVAGDQAVARFREAFELARDYDAPAVRSDGDLPRRRQQVARGWSVQVQACAIKQGVVEAVQIAPMTGDDQAAAKPRGNRCLLVRR